MILFQQTIHKYLYNIQYTLHFRKGSVQILKWLMADYTICNKILILEKSFPICSFLTKFLHILIFEQIVELKH